MQALVGAGDEVVAVVPVWPNLTAQPAILGATRDARCRCGRRRAAPGASTSSALLDAVTAPHARAARQLAEQPDRLDADARPSSSAILEHCRTHRHLDRRRRGLRAHSTSSPARARCAPSFLDIADADDRLIVVHSFSKSFLMTGWRLGWLVRARRRWRRAHRQADRVQHLVRAGVRAARRRSRRWPRADDFVPGLVARLKACRDTLLPRLLALPGVAVAPPRRAACTPSSALDGERRFAGARQAAGGRGRRSASRPARRSAPEAEGWLRWCFASRDPARLARGGRPAGCVPARYNRRLAAPAASQRARRRSVSPAFASPTPKPRHAASQAGARFHPRKRDARHHRTQGRDRQGARPRRQRHRVAPKSRSPC